MVSLPAVRGRRRKLTVALPVHRHTDRVQRPVVADALTLGDLVSNLGSNGDGDW